MAVSRQDDPRANQKERTRAAIVDAAINLLRDGVTPTVQAAAQAAKVSRATAYRYFPTQDSLLTEVLSVTPSTEVVDELLDRLPDSEIEERLEVLVDRFNRIALESEAEYRAALRVYLETWFEAGMGSEEGEDTPRLRAGRRMRWLARVLAPLRDRMTEREWERLRRSLSLTIGIDSIVILKDVCGLEDEDEIVDLLRWTARVIFDRALEESTAGER